MSKTTKTPPVPTRRPSKVAKPAKPVKRNVTAKPKTPGTSSTSADRVSTTAGAKKPEKSSGRVKSLLSGLSEWWSGGDAKTESKAGAKSESPTMSLDKGEFLRNGSSGEKVTQLQEMLKARGADIETDGKFGPKTKAALRKFQKENDLGADGVFGPATLAALNGSKPTEAAQTSEDAKTGAARSEGARAVDQTGKVEGGAQTAKSGKGRFANTRESLNKLPAPLRKYADTFQSAGEKYGVDPRFLAAISVHETAKGKSSAFRNKRNAMGISNRRGPIRMSSVEASINHMAKGLADPKGYYKGKTTIGGVAEIYAPTKNATNDPHGLNGYWPKSVARNFRKFGGDPTQQVIFR